MRPKLWYGGNAWLSSGELLEAKFAALFPHLDERQRRLAMAAEARVLGHGGVAVVARAAGVSRVYGHGRGPGELGAGGRRRWAARAGPVVAVRA